VRKEDMVWINETSEDDDTCLEWNTGTGRLEYADTTDPGTRLSLGLKDTDWNFVGNPEIFGPDESQ
jgi:hypothetical protein